MLTQPGDTVESVQAAARQAVQSSQTTSHFVNAILVRLAPGVDEDHVAEEIRRWKHLQAYTKSQMEEIMVAKLIATASKVVA